MDVDLHLARNALLVRCGRTEQAIAELRDRPDTSTWSIASRLADLLADSPADTGGPPEAGAVLDAVDRAGLTTTELAILLIRQGHAARAVALYPRHQHGGPGEGRPGRGVLAAVLAAVSRSRGPPAIPGRWSGR